MTATTTEARTTSVAATEELGRRLGERLRPGDLVILDGELGAGKTCFVRGLAVGMGVEVGLVRSPTFVFHHVYPGPRESLHHIDCYRLGPGADVGFLDLDDLLADGVVAMEWGGYAGLGALTAARVEIECGDGDERRFQLEAADSRLATAWSDAE